MQVTGNVNSNLSKLHTIFSVYGGTVGVQLPALNIASIYASVVDCVATGSREDINSFAQNTDANAEQCKATVKWCNVSVKLVAP
jgi:hypothetical protein